MEATELSRRLAEFQAAANETLRDVHELTEQQVKHWIVSPFLVALGWEPRDKKQVYPDFPTGGGTAPADFALLDGQGRPRVVVDARRPGESVSEPGPAQRQAQLVGAPLVLATNGSEFALWLVEEGDRSTPLVALSLKELAEHAESLLGLTAEYRGSDTGLEQLRRVAIRQAVLHLLEERSDRTFDAVLGWVRTEIAPNGGLDELSEQAIRDATLMWLTEEHLSMPGFRAPPERTRQSELRSTSVRDWEQFPRGPPGTFQYRFDSTKSLDVRQTPREVREALRNQGLRVATPTAFGGFYGALRVRSGLPAGSG